MLRLICAIRWQNTKWGLGQPWLSPRIRYKSISLTSVESKVMIIRSWKAEMIHFSVFLTYLLALKSIPIILITKVIFIIDIRIDSWKIKAIPSIFKSPMKNSPICPYPKNYMLKINMLKIRIKIKAKANNKSILRRKIEPTLRSTITISKLLTKIIKMTPID